MRKGILYVFFLLLFSACSTLIAPKQDFKVLKTEPSDGSSGWGNNYVVIYFSRGVAGESFRVKTNCKVEKTEFRVSNTAVVYCSFEPYSNYTFTIPKSVCDWHFNQLEEPYTFSFTTGEMK